MRTHAIRALAVSLLLAVIILVQGCAGSPPPGSLRLSDELSFGATVIDPRPAGGILLQSRQGAPVLVPASAATFASGGAAVAAANLVPGAPVLVTLPPQEARVVALDPSVVTLASSRGIVQLPLQALSGGIQARTLVPVTHGGTVVTLPLARALDLAGGRPLVFDHGTVRTVAWDPYAVQQGVLLGRSGEHLLVASPVNGTTALVRVPQERVDLLPGVRPGSGVLFTHLEPGMALEPWTLERRLGLVDLEPLGLNLQLVERVEGGALVMTPGGTTFLLPGGLPYTVGGRLAALDAVSPGTWLGLSLPATGAELIAVEGQVGTFLLPGHGLVQLPLSVLPSRTLAQTRVQVLKPNGNSVVVPLQAALHMQRAQGARIVEWVPISALAPRPPVQGVLSAFTGEHLLLLAPHGGRLVLDRLPRRHTKVGPRWAGRPVQVVREDRRVRLEPLALAGEVERVLEVRRGGSERAGEVRRDEWGRGRAEEVRSNPGGSERATEVRKARGPGPAAEVPPKSGAAGARGSERAAEVRSSAGAAPAKKDPRGSGRGAEASSGSKGAPAEPRATPAREIPRPAVAPPKVRGPARDRAPAPAVGSAPTADAPRVRPPRGEGAGVPAAASPPSWGGSPSGRAHSGGGPAGRGSGARSSGGPARVDGGGGKGKGGGGKGR